METDTKSKNVRRREREKQPQTYAELQTKMQKHIMV